MSFVNKPMPHETCSCGAEFFATAAGIDARERERASFREAHVQCRGEEFVRRIVRDEMREAARQAATRSGVMA